MDIVGCLVDGFCEEFVVHEVGARAGAQVAAVFDQLHAAQVDFAVSFDGIFDRVSRFCEGRRVKDDDVEFLAFFFEARKQFKNILADERCHVFQTV